MSNNVCVSWLEAKIPQFNKQMQAALEGGNRDVMKYYQALWMQCTSKKNTIEKACASEDLTIKEYVDILKNQAAKDSAMLEYFNQTGNQKNAAIVSERLKMQKAEIAEMDGM